ncbi:reverse transcriptase family protein [Alicyclobacillus fodiniaquatilis]|uniref:RNA-directed DNA polymerase n=1 Tax=Alicyclobacillus fodiniaquatilis TaxID=1661150 RepID=A0ABW4JGF8_9BACL
MDWSTYQEKFYHSAKLKGCSDEYISNCLHYAQKFVDRNLPVIFDTQHLSLLIGIDEKYLFKVSNRQDLFYRHFAIPKKSKNGYREIAEPLPNLKIIQQWILDEILYYIQPSIYTKSYKKSSSIKDNARFHRGQKKVLTIDIVDFFGHVKYSQVRRLFSEIGYRLPVATMLARLCTLNECLPQGACTSPAISNLIFKNIDYRISSYARKLDVRYTRYADDLTFSGDFDPGRVVNFVRYVLNENNFTVNDGKTRLREQHQRQEVTGIVVNTKMQVSKELRRKIGQEVYYIRKFGLKSHLRKIGAEVTPESYLRRLMGLCNHAVFVNSKDSKLKSDLTFLKSLYRELDTRGNIERRE